MNQTDFINKFNQIEIQHCRIPGCLCKISLATDKSGLTLAESVFDWKGSVCHELKKHPIEVIVEWLSNDNTIVYLTDEQKDKVEKLLKDFNDYINQQIKFAKELSEEAEKESKKAKELSEKTKKLSKKTEKALKSY